MQIGLTSNPASAVLYSSGGFGDVFKCMNQSLEVTIKALKVPYDADLRKVSLVSHSQITLSLTCTSVFTATHAEVL